jgi:hypothetical protein
MKLSQDDLPEGFVEKALNAIGVQARVSLLKEIHSALGVIARHHPIQRIFSEMPVSENDVILARTESGG